jgi:hypothetical protein
MVEMRKELDHWTATSVSADAAGEYCFASGMTVAVKMVVAVAKEPVKKDVQAASLGHRD